MSAQATPAHYPTLVPVSIRALEVTLARLEVPDATTSLEELAAFAELTRVLTHAQQAQRVARDDHPRLIEDEPDHDAANVVAFPVTAGRHGGRTTSARAARSLELKVGHRRTEVLATLVAAYPGGLTDRELEARLGWEHTAGAKRRNELLTLGLVEPAVSLVDGVPITLERTPAGATRPATVWRVTDRGRPALEALGYSVDEVMEGGQADPVALVVTPPLDC